MDRRAEIAVTFQRHYGYYRKIGDETRRQQVEAERSIKLQYSGRATFELLQNAFDRAEKHVVASVVEEEGGPACLIVGNDGQALTVDAAFDYERPVLDPDSHKRSDFHALCSLHTSNKTPEQSIGNKGVGFRSVFSLADRVSILILQRPTS